MLLFLAIFDFESIDEFVVVVLEFLLFYLLLNLFVDFPLMLP